MKRPAIVISSATAYVDPTVQIHAAGCEHAARRVDDPEWSSWGPFYDDDEAQAVAYRERGRIGAADVAFMDCSLGGH